MNNLTPPGEEVLEQIGITFDNSYYEIINEQQAQYIVIEYWLTIYNPDPQSENIQQIKGYLEAFNHLCDLEEYDKAWKLISIPLNTPTNEELRNQLNTWGYALQQLEIHHKLLHKIPEYSFLILLGIGEAYNSLGNYKKSLHFFEKAHEEVKKSEDEVTILDALGGSCLLSNDYEKAIKYYEKALKILFQSNNQEKEMNILENLGKAYFFGKRNYKKAFDYSKQSLTLAQQLKNRRGEGAAFKNLGDCYVIWKQYDKAKECYQKSLDIMEKIVNLQGQEVAIEGFGIIHLYLEEYDKANDCFKKALKIARQIDNRRGEGEILCKLGLFYYQQRNYEQAIKYCQLGLSVAQEINNRQAQRASLALLAMVYLEQEEYGDAIKYHEEAVHLAREMGDLDWVGVNLAYLSKSYLANGNNDQALEYCEESLAIAKQTKNSIVEIMALNGKLKIYNLLGNNLKVAELSMKLTAALSKNLLSNIWQRFTNNGV